MLTRNANGHNNGLSSDVFKLKSMMIMSCLLLGKTSGLDWRAEPDDVWKLWVPGTLSLCYGSCMFRTVKRSLVKNELSNKV